MPDFVIGIDASYHQGGMNYSTAVSAGAKFCFIRGGSITYIDGQLYEDYRFRENADEAPNHLPTGVYFYARPNYNALKQAKYFVSLIRPYYDSGKFLLRPVVDVETTGGMTPDEIRDFAKTFCEYVLAELGIDWMYIYTRGTFWNPYVTHDDWFTQNTHLWVARYTEYYEHPWNDNPTVLRPKSWADWDFWQYSADGNGRGAEFGAESGSIDIDYFNGNEEEFQTYVYGEEPVITVERKVINKRLDVEANNVNYVYVTETVPENELWEIGACSGFASNAVNSAELRVVQSGMTLQLAKQANFRNWVTSPGNVGLYAGDKISFRAAGVREGDVLYLRFHVKISRTE